MQRVSIFFLCLRLDWLGMRNCSSIPHYNLPAIFDGKTGSALADSKIIDCISMLVDPVLFPSRRGLRGLPGVGINDLRRGTLGRIAT
jgi:hypothetical protein